MKHAMPMKGKHMMPGMPMKGMEGKHPMPGMPMKPAMPKGGMKAPRKPVKPRGK